MANQSADRRRNTSQEQGGDNKHQSADDFHRNAILDQTPHVPYGEVGHRKRPLHEGFTFASLSTEFSALCSRGRSLPTSRRHPALTAIPAWTDNPHTNVVYQDEQVNDTSDGRVKGVPSRGTR